MAEGPTDKAQEVADHVQRLAEEIETHADVALGGAALESGRARIHEWIEGMTGFVVNAAQAQVTIIHANGRQSTIFSPDLPFLLVRPPSTTD